MRPYFALKAFRHWLKANRKRFRNPPYIAHIRRNGFDVRFSGVSQHITCSIGRHGSAGIWVRYDGQCWDSLSEFDFATEKAPQGGYYCKFCKTSQLFASRQTLLIEHLWEPLLEWVNEKFAATAWVCLYGGKDFGITAAKLKQEHEVERERERDFYFLTAFPVLVTTAQAQQEKASAE